MVLHLGAATTTGSKSLQVELSLPLILVPVVALVDSGSSDCFVDSVFVSKYCLPCRKIKPLPLTLIDGTINHFVNHVMSLPIRFPCSYSCQTEFFVTKLEGTYPTVLGHNWLTQNNPLINWRKGTLKFDTPEPAAQPISPRSDSKPQNLPSGITLSSENLPVDPVTTPCANSSSIRHLVKNDLSEDRLSNDQSSPKRPQISLVNAAAFKNACKSRGAISF